jgi:hypothetical protein
VNAKQATKVQAYLREAADKLGLKHWNVTLSVFPLEDEDLQAEITQSECQHAVVKLPERFFGFSPAYQRLVLAHELCHLHLARMDECVQASTEVMEANVYKLFFCSYSDAEEQAVEAFARLLAPSLPLPRFK